MGKVKVCDDRSRLTNFPLVSVLFVTYKRPELLKEALVSFRKHTDYPNLELIVADDGSPRHIQEDIRALPFDKFALASKNRGLGANNNQGMNVATGKYILMIQDDRHCAGPSDYLEKAVRLLEANPQVGLLNFSGPAHIKDDRIMLADNDAGDFHVVKLAPLAVKREYLYTDEPHIMTAVAFGYVGPYKEDRDMERCEDNYMRRWEAQRLFATVINGKHHDEVFVNVGIARSFRENRFRYRVDRLLLPIGKRLKTRSPKLFVMGRFLARLPARLLEKLRIVR